MVPSHQRVSAEREITGYVTAHHTQSEHAAALRDMTTKPSQQLFPRINGHGVKRSATNDSQFPAEWDLRKNNRPLIELNAGTFEPQ